MLVAQSLYEIEEKCVKPSVQSTNAQRSNHNAKYNDYINIFRTERECDGFDAERLTQILYSLKRSYGKQHRFIQELLEKQLLRREIIKFFVVKKYIFSTRLIKSLSPKS